MDRDGSIDDLLPSLTDQPVTYSFNRCGRVGVAVYCTVTTAYKIYCSSRTKEDPTVLNDIRDDLRQECEKFGTVKKIMIYDV